MAFSVNDTLLSKPPKNGKCYIIAVDGRGGAGKTTLTELLGKRLPDFTIINGDDYFEPAENTIAFGAFNEERFFADVISPLQQAKTTFPYRRYDWHSEPHITERELTISRGVIIERSFSFAFDLDYDLKIWVETPAKLALQRGQERDEMPLEQGYRSWKEVWQPQEAAHIKKVKPLETADIVIDGTKPFDTQLA